MDGKTAKRILTEKGFEKGTTTKMEVIAKDVGVIFGITLSETVTDNWIPDKIIVRRAGREESIFLAKCD